MSDRPIAVGDLVVVARDCCGHWLGRVFVAGEFMKTPRLECGECNWHSSATAVKVEHYIGRMWCMNLSWLKRIPPLSELEGERTEEQIKEPA